MTVLPDFHTETFEEVSIKCEWDEYDCPHNATVMSKACGDDRHYAICPDHLRHLRRWFAANRRRLCDCGRPFLFFETHYSLEFL